MKSKSVKVATYAFKTGMEMLKTQPSPNGVEPLTIGEKLSKKIDIKVELKNLHNPKESGDLKKCQLVVYLNGKIKYVSKKGALKEVAFERVEADWKIWHFVNHRVVFYKGIQFRSPQDRQHFHNFCALCRVCYRIDAEYEKLRKEFLTEISA